MSDVTRITQQSATMLMVADLENSLGTLTQLQQQAASGKSINQPSDNPGGASQVLTLNAQLGRFNQYASNISDGQSWLDSASSALGSVIKALDQVQTDVLQGANASSNDASSGQALSQEVTTLKQELITLSATTYDGRYIFSGTYGTAPYPQGSASGSSDPTSSSYDPATAYAYAGSTSPVTRVIAPGQSQAVSITGDQIFGTGTSSVFALLDTISQDLANGNSANLSGADLSELKSYISSATQAQGNAGALGAALASASTQVSDTVTSLQDQVASIQDANEAQVASELDLAETSYQAALETTAKIIQPSLVQFIS